MRIPATLLLAFIALPVPRLKADDSTLFQDQVAPLLKDRCIICHNPQKSRGGVDLTSREAMLQGGDKGPVLVPGTASKSLLIEVISGAKPRMPKQGPKLTAEEVAALQKWISAGAVWPKEVKLTAGQAGPRVGPDWWSLKPLTRPAMPEVKDRHWPRTPIDAFILATLEAKGMTPSPAADKRTLIRRATFDLLGLPPMPQEIDAFISDNSPDAYEKLIDRLLDSPHYGERWGRNWLDVVHYGDSHGYDKDKRREHAWPYRDYVIRSFNQDKPYDRFIREQIAGDVLYPGDPQSIIATGFIVAGPWDFVGHVELREGTVDKLKTRVLDRDDMVTTTIATFNSMTVHCARCHDHKFDPIKQEDYYNLQAVFAGVERGNRPYSQLESPRQREQLAERQQRALLRQTALRKKAGALDSPELRRIDDRLASLRNELATLPAPPTGPPSPSNGYHSGIAPKPDVEKWVQVDLGQSLPIDEIRLIPARPTDFPDTPGFGFPARFRVAISDDPAFVTCETVADHTRQDFPNPKNSAVVLRPEGKRARYVRVHAQRLWLRTNDYVFALAELEVDSGGKNVARGAAVTALDSIEAGRWSKRFLVDQYDSRHKLPDQFDSKAAASLQRRSELESTIRLAEQERQLKAESLLDPATREELTKTTVELVSTEGELKKIAAPLQVYAAISQPPRTIQVLHRGDVEQPKAEVRGGALMCVPGFPGNLKIVDPGNEGSRRQALAEWLTDARNVLTWRSIVNRVWHYHFGRGIVDTPNDFGWNGSRPSHPELLDWLAVEFRDGGQSLKKLHRLIILSSTYRQVSTSNPAFARLDADNRFLWRMNRQRLDAEALRDTTLAVTGQLNLTMGGPGYDLFRFKDDHSPVYDHTALEKIHDPATYRRTVYRFVVRSVANPFLECLDSADPNLNTPVRNTTITALQALALLNDPFMVKQAEFFADRLRGLGSSPERQIDRAFRFALGRPATPEESTSLIDYAQRHGLANACRVLFNMNEFVFVD
jgi:mono/diheme cytochrome c family protein